MCLSPFLRKNNSIYYNRNYSQSLYQCSCGKCDECRTLHRNEWETRFSYEVYDCQVNNHGKVVVLLFTYNNDNLPFYVDEEAGFRFVCFNKNHILQFLNLLKIRMYRKYGAGTYRYFIAAEYGKNTRRPHYHAAFFLSSVVDPVFFAELCRELWQYGFMFPKFDPKSGIYVDSNNKPSTIFLKNMAGGAKYLSKYIMKDMSYFGNPDLSFYISDPIHKIRIKDFLPKHFQSNGFGFGLFSNLNESNFVDSLNRGVLNPLTKKYVQMPQYAINKLFYKYVSTAGTPYERIGINGKPLYDRILTDFGRNYFRQLYENKINCLCYKFQSFFKSNSTSLVRFSLNRLHINVDNPVSFRNLSIYKIYLRYFSNYPLLYNESFNDNILSVFEDNELLYDIYLKSRDIKFLRDLPHHSVNIDFTFRRNPFKDYDFLVTFYEETYRQIRKNSYANYSEREKLVDEYRFNYSYKFDKNLC